MAKETLSQYLRNRLLLMGCILAGVFSVLMYTVYNWGLDDSSEHYLLQDAQYAQSLLAAKQSLPVNNNNKQYYLGVSALPDNYRAIVDSHLERVSKGIQYFTFQNADSFTYGIKLPLNDSISSNENLFVFHRFHFNEGDELPGMSIFEVAVLTLLGVLLVMALGATLIYLRVIKSMQALQLFSDQQCLDTACVKDSDQQRALWSMQFTEVQKFALQLQAALQKTHNQTQKERMLIQGLSHELRTPMAITSVALDLLQKKDLDKKVKDKLQKIRVANNDMVSLANTLLSIWKNEKSVSSQNVCVSSLILQIIEGLQSVHLPKGVHFKMAVPGGLSLLVALAPLKIVLENLLRNAVQYSEPGSVYVGANESAIWVENKVSTAQSQSFQEKDCSPSPSPGYGYGLGLYIAQQACNNQGWQLVIESGSFYKASVIVSPNAIM